MGEVCNAQQSQILQYFAEDCFDDRNSTRFAASLVPQNIAAAAQVVPVVHVAHALLV